MVEAMHGHLYAESIPNQGSVFHFTARFARSKASIPQEKESAKEKEKENSSTSSNNESNQ